MKGFEVKCRLKGTITYEPYDAPMKGSYIHSEEADVEQEVELSVYAKDEERAIELVKAYDYYEANRENWHFNSIEIVEVKEISSDDDDKEEIEILAIDEIDFDYYIYREYRYDTN